VAFRTIAVHLDVENIRKTNRIIKERYMQITYIGTIQTPFEDREGMPIQPTGAKDIQGRVIIHPEYESREE
jgi:hypothetical protein